MIDETIRVEDIGENSLRQLIDACGPEDILRLGKHYRAVVVRLLDTADAARRLHAGLTCAHDPMDVDERIEALAAVLSGEKQQPK